MVCLGPNCKKSAGRDNFCSKSCEAEYAAINSPKVAINTKPAINEERLTDAINGSDINRRVAGRSASSRDGDRGMLSAHRPARDEPGTSGPSVVVSPVTPNRRSREAYNAYMRGYMKAYRGRRG